MPKKKSKREISSGGLVYRITDRSPELLLIKDPKGNWSYPKGLIELNEDPKIAAQREIVEEAGISNLVFKYNLGTVNYTYTFRSTVVFKTVHYFLFQTLESRAPQPQHEEGITEASFFPIDKVKSILGYPKTNLPILDLALKYLKSTHHV